MSASSPPLPFATARAPLALSVLSLLVASCSTFGGTDAGPTVGTFHIDIAGATSSTVPGSFDATVIRANSYMQAPSNSTCGTAGYTEVIVANGVVRGYLRIRQVPVVNGVYALVDNACAEYFTIARNPGLPLEERWKSTTGTLTVTNATGTGFDFAITASMTADATMHPTMGDFAATVTATVHNPQGS